MPSTEGPHLSRRHVDLDTYGEQSSKCGSDAMAQRPKHFYADCM